MTATLARPVAVVTPTLYRYIGENRGIDQPSTKRFRKRMRELTFELLADDGVYAQAQGSDGRFYAWVPLQRLEIISASGGIK